MFTVPSGGDGVYYFSTFLGLDQGEAGIFSMNLNGEVICSLSGDHNTSGGGDSIGASCSAIAEVVAGKTTLLAMVDKWNFN